MSESSNYSFHMWDVFNDVLAIFREEIRTSNDSLSKTAKNHFVKIIVKTNFGKYLIS
jgi:hypothetical protein